ncbi:hypothetical protein ACFOTA_04350 [Chitinophaga sp. GCM10012297]|uniref:Uncharacterized protein n=1 Tax=Chitinophaga chungangae TaxID=2821488 RepID=A0ABS3Y9R3_9BACT|nr:hypothetical protein [Chitinophaga chungangae]MBO9151425.1 hypothetical protein [Chitinophaga chungangae]
MNPRFLALMSASVWCSAASAQQLPKRDTFPYPRYITQFKDSLRKDSVPMRVYQLKEFNVRHRGLAEDSAMLKKLMQPKLNLVLPFEEQKGITYEKEGKTHHLPGVSLNVAAIASVFDFKKKARDEAFRRRITAKLEERAVDRMYNAYLVGRFIPLKGDSLEAFIEKTRPNAGFLMGVTAYDLGVYVKQRYKEYTDTLKN